MFCQSEGIQSRMPGFESSINVKAYKACKGFKPMFENWNYSENNIQLFNVNLKAGLNKGIDI